MARSTRRKRRWAWVISAFLLVFVLLLMLAPTIASMSWVRAIVLGRINQRINGHIEIQDLSLGWISGTRLERLAIYDRMNRPLLKLSHLGTTLNVWDLVRGRYDLAETRLDGLDVVVSRDGDGNLNWETLLRAGPTIRKPRKRSDDGPKEAVAQRPHKLKLPGLSGEFELNKCSLTWEDCTTGQVLHLRAIQGRMRVADIDFAISDLFSMQAQIGSGPPGVLAASGTIAAVKDNLLDLQHAAVDQTVRASGVDLAAISTLVGPDAPLRIAGRTDGELTLRASGGAEIIEAQAKTADFRAIGPALNGQSFRSERLSFVLPKTVLQLPSGFANFGTARLQIGSRSGYAILLRAIRDGHELTLFEMPGDVPPPDPPADVSQAVCAGHSRRWLAGGRARGA